MNSNARDTGRVSTPLTASARRILFEKEHFDDLIEQLEIMKHVDCAHLMMLSKRGIVDKPRAVKLIDAILNLAATNFEPLRGRVPLRGLYLLYEEYLIQTEGPDVGGMLQTARSRNDLNATVLQIRTRQPYLRLLKAVMRLQVSLLFSANRRGDSLLPAYTHNQPAEPITLGHYLAAVAESLDRHLVSLLNISDELQHCPLGACAVAGTRFPIDVEYTARILGFEYPVNNSVHAVASRDYIHRLLAELAILGTTLSRAATDLSLWVTGEFGFLSLPDDLVGSSSAMPQKRNPFLLEHIQGRSATALASFVHSISSSRSTPFTNSISAGAESIRLAWQAFEDSTDALALLRLIVSNMRLNPQRAYERAISGGTMATALAAYLVQKRKMNFRSAHRRVGLMFKELGGSPTFDEIREYLSADADFDSVPDTFVDPRLIVQHTIFGGGPGTCGANIDRLRTRLRARVTSVRELEAKWRLAQHELEAAVKHFRTQ